MISCVSPISIRHPTRSGVRITVPCGKCCNCKITYRTNWSFRLNKESLSHKYSIFFTLTYNEENKPKGVNKRDIQLFLKRLRKHFSFRYFICAEYGKKTKRPHYHGILFYDNEISNVEDLICSTWNNGFCHFGKVTEKSVFYILKYVLKNEDEDEKNTDYPVFNLMSRRPAIGSNYLTSEVVKYHRTSKSFSCRTLGGQKIRLPRYYRDKIFDKEDIELHSLRKKLEYEKREIEKVAEYDFTNRGCDNANYYKSQVESLSAYIDRVNHEFNKKERL